MRDPIAEGVTTPGTLTGAYASDPTSMAGSSARVASTAYEEPGGTIRWTPAMCADNLRFDR